MLGGALVAFVILLAIYFAPTIVALDRRHRHRLAIFLINLLFGWSLIGWAGALLWAVLGDEETMPAR